MLPLTIAALLVATLESPNDALAASLRSGDIDFILSALRIGSEVKDLQQEVLFEDRISMIARAGHPLTRGARIDFAALRQSTWMLSWPGSPSQELLEQFSSLARQAHPVPAVETGKLAVLRGLQLERDMVTAISAHKLRDEIRDGRLAVLDFALGQTQRHIGITQRVGCFPAPGARALMNAICDFVKTLDC